MCTFVCTGVTEFKIKQLILKALQKQVVEIEKENSGCWEMCQFNTLALKLDVMSAFYAWNLPH